MKQRLCCNLDRDARVLLLSQRAWNRQFYMPLVYEFEDVIASVDAAHILCPPFLYGSGIPGLAYRASNYLRARSGLLTHPGIEKVELERDYDLFFCLLNFPYEIPAFRRLEKLRARCRRAVCMFVEVWSYSAEQYRRSFEILNELEFDCVFVNQSSCLPRVRQVVRRPCFFLPQGVDTLRFAPYPRTPARVIDYYSFGRTSAITHKALMRLAESNGAFYFFDSAVRYKWSDCFEHRVLTANLLQRTRYLIAHAASLRTDVSVGTDQTIGARHLEGPAAGAILIGVPPRCRDFDENFDWPDAVIPMSFNCENVEAFIADIESDPDRVAAALRVRQGQLRDAADAVSQLCFSEAQLSME